MLKQYLSDGAKRPQQISFVLVVVAVIGIGTYLLASSHATTPYVSSDADTGNVVAPAVAQTCASASDGRCVVFGSATTASTSRPTIVGHELELGTTGTRLKMRGVAVWGIEDDTTVNGSTGVNEYNNRQTVVNTIKSWGGNEIRLRVLACDYNNQTYMSQAQELQEIKDWQTTAQAAGLYLGITWWDPSDCGTQSHASWASNYSEAFPMMTAVINELGVTNPWVFYEPFNEPNNISDSSWLTAMEATDKLIRGDGYSGILVFDTNNYSHEYNDSLMTDLESYDAGQTGMNGQNQVIFAKHDYSNEYPNPSTFDTTDWANNTYGNGAWDFSKHLVWETEFGNYNCVNQTCSGAENLSWSQQAASAMATEVNNATIVGATGFVFTWVDPNTMTTGNDVTPTQWGGYVKNNFLGSVN
jgi:hypothetical protein